MLFECCHLVGVRESKWDEAVRTMPDEMFSCMDSNNSRKTAFILQGVYHKQGIIEWIAKL